MFATARSKVGQLTEQQAKFVVSLEFGDTEAMASAIDRLLGDARLCRRLGENAARDAHARFGDFGRAAFGLLGFGRLAGIARRGRGRWGRRAGSHFRRLRRG